jgi:hypothetical protein
MPPAVKKATKIQLGMENPAARGTLVAATRRLIGEGRLQRVEDLEEWTERDFGVLARTARAPVVTRNGAIFEYRSDMSFEELLLIGLCGIKGAQTPSGAMADKTWAFLHSNVADPAPDTATIEMVESDLTNNAEVEFGYGFVTEFEITGGVEKVPQMRISMVGRKLADSTMTAAIAIPTEVFSPNLKWGAYLDPSWATLGATQVLEQVYGFTWKCTTGLFPQYYMDARGNLDFSAYHFREASVDVQLDVVSNADPAKLVQTEEANKTSGAIRFLQLKILGDVLGASFYKTQLDVAGYHASDSMREIGNDRDGNLVRRMHLVSAYDPTSANDYGLTVVNALATFP